MLRLSVWKTQWLMCHWLTEGHVPDHRWTTLGTSINRSVGRGLVGFPQTGLSPVGGERGGYWWRGSASSKTGRWALYLYLPTLSSLPLKNPTSPTHKENFPLATCQSRPRSSLDVSGPPGPGPEVLFHPLFILRLSGFRGRTPRVRSRGTIHGHLPGSCGCHPGQGTGWGVVPEHCRQHSTPSTQRSKTPTPKTERVPPCVTLEVGFAYGLGPDLKVLALELREVVREVQLLLPQEQAHHELLQQ